jgi:hypothetical protein
MPAKLLEFYGLSLNKHGVSYFLMTKSKDDTFTCKLELGKVEDPEYKLIGIIFGAQQSMVIRKVVKTALMSRKSS